MYVYTTLQVHCQACLAIRNLASDGKLSTSTPCAFLSNSYLFSFFPPPPSLPLFCSLPSADENQKRIVDYGGLDVLVPLLRSSDTETVTAAVAALRNLSIHNGNEVSRKGRWCGWVWYIHVHGQTVNGHLLGCVHVCVCVCVCTGAHC